MATNVTSLVSNEPKSVNLWFQMCGRRFAMLAIANLQHAWTFHKTSHRKPARQPRRHPSCIAVLVPARNRLIPVECEPTSPRYEQSPH
jgi:hypothetical protein